MSNGVSGPLKGVRVADLTRYWAGPHCTELLAHLGAEVIKVEPTHGAGLMRQRYPQRALLPEDDPRAKFYNRVAYFDQVNVNKLSVALDITSPEGREVVLRLVAISDVVVNNYSAEMMPKLGLDYETLKKAKPDIIACSMPAYGTTGPWDAYLGYGVTLEPLAGYFSVTGYPGDEPTRSGVDHFDPLTGTHAAAAILTALLYRRRSGKGQFVDVSHLESGAMFLGEALMDYFMNQRVRTRNGNRHPFIAPHGCYRCKGEDRWVTIATRDDAEWQKLCQIMGHPALAHDERFRDGASRWQHQDEIDSVIQEWTAQQEHYEVMEKLQSAKIPAGAVLSVEEVAQNPHLQARGFFKVMEHPQVGALPLMTPPWRMANAQADLHAPAPCYGQHNEYVLHHLLKMEPEEVERLTQAGVIARQLGGGNPK